VNLIDNALSPALARGLRAAGFEATHVRELGLAKAADEVLFLLAEREERVIVSADTDFGQILALRASTKPSVLLFRHGAPRLPGAQLSLLLAHLDTLRPILAQGAVVTIEGHRMRVRPLPIQGS